MRKSLKIPFTTLLAILALLGCRKEEFELIPDPAQQTLAGSPVAGLLENTALNDGSIDNIIDRSNCTLVKLPYIVNANGTDILIDDQADYANVEAIFEASQTDLDLLVIAFPVMVILSDFTEVMVADQTQLNTITSSCPGENLVDADIECIDIQYPITASIFNTITEVFDIVTMTSDYQLYAFITSLESDDLVDIKFPINVIMADGTQIATANLDQLENAIEDAQDSCDEDDDFDYDDDDCGQCTTTQLTDVLTSCSNWSVDTLERNDDDLEDNFAGYLFNCDPNGTLTANSGTTSYSGTWESSGSANAITVTFNIPNLGDFNANWFLHEIEQESGIYDIDFRLGDDKLSFESNCATGNGDNNSNNGPLGTFLSDGLWTVGSYTEDDDDQTDNYSGYTFDFDPNGTVTASNGTTTNGTWAAMDSDSELLLNFGSAVPLDEFNDTWNVVSATSTRVEIQDISGEDGGTDTLILIKQ